MCKIRSQSGVSGFSFMNQWMTLLLGLSILAGCSNVGRLSVNDPVMAIQVAQSGEQLRQNESALHFFSAAKSIMAQQDCLAWFDKKYDNIGVGSQQANNEAATFKAGRAAFLTALKTVDCHRFIYQVGDVLVDGFVTKPIDAAPQTLPAIIYNRGGHDVFGLISFDLLNMDHMFIAKKGFVVISSQYRGANVWGKDVTFNIGKDEFGGRDVDDVRALIPILAGMPEVDSNRIGMMGISRGGLMTFLAAKKNPDIKAIAVWAGPTDLFSLIQRRPEFDKTLFPRLIPDYQNTKSQALTARSVMFWLDQLDEKLPILLLHGDEDKQVAVANSIDLAARLKERGQVHKLIIYPKAGHSLSPYGFAARDEIIKWFSTWLQPIPLKAN